MYSEFLFCPEVSGCFISINKLSATGLGYVFKNQTLKNDSLMFLQLICMVEQFFRLILWISRIGAADSNAAPMFSFGLSRLFFVKSCLKFFDEGDNIFKLRNIAKEHLVHLFIVFF